MCYLEYEKAYWIPVYFTLFQGKETLILLPASQEQRHHLSSRNSWEGRISPGLNAAYPSVNLSWIFHVLEMAELPEFICRFLRMIYCNSTTHVEFAGSNSSWPGAWEGRISPGFKYWPRDFCYMALLYRMMRTQVVRLSASSRTSCLINQW